MPTRRTTTLGLGAMLAGAGTVLGTGAFSSVEAQRSVSLSTAGDADAFLAFEVIDDDYVDLDNGMIAFELIADARTTFTDLVAVRNQGTRSVQSLQFEFAVTAAGDPPGPIEDALQIVSGTATIPARREANLLAVSDAIDSNELEPSAAIPFGILVDLTGDEIDAISDDTEITLTIIANTQTDETNGDDPPAPDPTPEPSFVFKSPPTVAGGNGPVDFAVENTGDPVTVTGFQITASQPGGQTPESFESYSITDDAGLSRSGGENGNGDFPVGEPVIHAEHGESPFTADPESPIDYEISGFDRNVQGVVSSGELGVTLVGDSDGDAWEVSGGD